MLAVVRTSLLQEATMNFYLYIFFNLKKNGEGNDRVQK